MVVIKTVITTYKYTHYCFPKPKFRHPTFPRVCEFTLKVNPLRQLLLPVA